MKKTLLALFLVFSLTTGWCTICNAQFLARTVVSAAGETFIKPGISMTYVVGEAVDELLSNNKINKFLTVGFLQPDVEISQIINGSSKSLAIFPNPANGGIVKLAFNHVPDGIYDINIYDANGKIMQAQQQVQYSKSDFYYFPIDISHYSGGTYFIQVVSPAKFSGEVKLIKY
jgi:hypothetical protein